MNLDAIAEKIYDTELFQDSDTVEQASAEKTRISAWLETNIGQLNILINQAFRISESNDVCPVIKDEEIAIFIQLYLKYYYTRQAQSILRQASSGSSQSSSTSEWTELTEGDSTIKRIAQIASPQQKISISQTYKNLAVEADIKISEMVHSYNMYRASPRQVAGYDAAANDCSSYQTPTPTP